MLLFAAFGIFWTSARLLELLLLLELLPALSSSTLMLLGALRSPWVLFVALDRSHWMLILDV